MDAPAPSAALTRFQASMRITYEMWHEGIGYDLDALRALAGDERQTVEAKLLAQLSDWRDIEALDTLATEAAYRGIRTFLGGTNLELRLHAAQCLSHRKRLTADEMENILLHTLPQVTILTGLSLAIRLAEAHPTESIRRFLLFLSLHGNDDLRTHAAALAHFLHGGSRSAFDWKHRPLYLRLGSTDPVERQTAYTELCASIHIDPAWPLSAPNPPPYLF